MICAVARQLSARRLHFNAIRILTPCSHGYDQNVYLLRFDILTIGGIYDERVAIDSDLLLDQSANVDDVYRRIPVVLVDFDDGQRL